MSKVDDKAPPSRSELRNFGLLTGGLFAAIFGLLFPWLHARHFPIWPWILCVLLAGSALVAPQALKPVFRAWTALGWVLGWINSRIIMTVVFYVIVTPTGAIMRLFGSDPMGRKFDPSCASYRVSSRQAPTQSMDRPF